MVTIVCYDLMEEIGKHYKMIKIEEKSKKKYKNVVDIINQVNIDMIENDEYQIEMHPDDECFKIPTSFHDWFFDCWSSGGMY